MQKLPVAALLSVALLQGCMTQPDNDINDLAVIYQPEAGAFSLSWQADKPQQAVTVLVSEGPDFSDTRVLAEQLHASGFDWQAEHNSNRYYFRVQPGSGQAATASSRWLPLQRGRNFRDMGGYITTDGQQRVRWGKLYRSGALNGLTDSDQRELQEAQIATIVDFRTRQERLNEATVWLDPRTEQLSWDYDMDMSSMATMFDGAELTAERMESLMAQAYPGIVQSMTSQYTAMFDRLASNDGALLFHCTAGKDRTGVAGALILTALGVDRETIRRDFMLSDDYYSSMSASRPAFGDSGDPHMQKLAQLPPEVLQPLMGVRESYLDAAFAYMEQDSGSVLAYIQRRLSVSDEELQSIRERLLVPRS